MSEDSEGVPRRYMLQTLGAAGAAGLAGCSSGGDNGSNPTTSAPEETETYEDTTTQTERPQVDHLDTTSLATEWAVGEELGNQLVFDSYSPSQLKNKYGTTFTEATDASPYSILPFSAHSIPETFIQEQEEPFPVVLKVDQLPGGVSESEMVESLQANDYEKQTQISGFDVYSNPVGETVHAIGEGRHAMTFNLISNDGAATSQLRQYLDDTLEEKGNDNNLTGTLGDLKEGLDVNDTFTVYRDYSSPFIHGISSRQPEAGASSVNVEEGLKYGAWVFTDAEGESGENWAKYAYKELLNGEIGNSYETVNHEGNMVTAVGNADVAQRLETADESWAVVTSRPFI